MFFPSGQPPQVLAKDLVRTRNYVTKFIEFRSHLQGVGLKLETVRSHEAMAGAMKDVTKAMVSLNKQVNTKTKERRGETMLCISQVLRSLHRSCLGETLAPTQNCPKWSCPKQHNKRIHPSSFLTCDP